MIAVGSVFIRDMMQVRMQVVNAVRGLCVAMLVAVAGCASVPAVAPTAEEVVRQRAQERWAALMAGEWGRAYNLMAPSYRAVVAEKRFSAQYGGGGVGWTSAEVVSVSCEEDRCTVRMKIGFRAIGMGSGGALSTGFNETWVREEGQWWMFEKI